ncbi:MAG: NUDIX hydrolase [Desulfatiglandales bacterium]
MEINERDIKEVRPASTIILVREQEGDLQVYLLKRSRGSGFFPGNYVFPGGAVDPEEWHAESWKDCIDLSAESLLGRFGHGLDLRGIIAYGVAAIRETFEEAGVFLSRKEAGFEESLDRVCRLRSSGALGEGWFKEKVLGEGWSLSFSELFPWAHWITPEAMHRRFDTRFFLAFMPEAQKCVPDDLETVHGLWVRPEDGLRGNMEGAIPLSPPTVITLHELLAFRSLRELEKAVRTKSWGEPRRPVFVKSENGGVILEPWDPMYGQEIEIDYDRLADKVVSPGDAFSRIWLHEGIWLPVRA